ncbi:MAG: Bug family tripartite tricarboxylate transporter substrate binding protein [Betaproteobacteria bacterium]
MGSAVITRAIMVAALAMVALPCMAQTYPVRPVRLLIPFPPGGGADINGRLIGKALTERWGVQIVVDNRPGASNMIASEIVVKSAPDGHTLLMATATHAINPSMFVKRPYDEMRDFTPIVVVSKTPNMIAINPTAPFKAIPDMVSWAKANPGKVTYGTGGHATHQHMAVEMFRALAGIDITHVPYKGGVPAINDAIGGRVMMASVSVLGLAPYHKAGRLRGIAVSSARRSPMVPDIPTIAEQGYPGFEVIYWLGLIGPAKMPPAVVAKINKDVNAALKAPDVRDQFLAQGGEPAGGTPQEFDGLIKREIKEWIDTVKRVGLKPQ